MDVIVVKLGEWIIVELKVWVVGVKGVVLEGDSGGLEMNCNG